MSKEIEIKITATSNTWGICFHACSRINLLHELVKYNPKTLHFKNLKI